MKQRPFIYEVTCQPEIAYYIRANGLRISIVPAPYFLFQPGAFRTDDEQSIWSLLAQRSLRCE